MRRIFTLSVVIAFLTSGCSSVKTIDINTIQTNIPKLDISVDNIELFDVQYNVTQIDNTYVYTLTEDEFKKNLQNNLNVLKLLHNQMRVIDAYKKYYEEH